MESKDKYQLFKDIYLELLHCELRSRLSNNHDHFTYESISDLDMEKLHKLVFSRAFTLTLFVKNDIQESMILKETENDTI